MRTIVVFSRTKISGDVNYLAFAPPGGFSMLAAEENFNFETKEYIRANILYPGANIHNYSQVKETYTPFLPSLIPITFSFFFYI